MSKAVLAYIALGANLGDAVHSVTQACVALGQLPSTQLLRCSSLYRTAPFEADGPDFINAVAAVQTALSAPDLLAALHTIEHAAGRERPYRNAPRLLDLDLLCYGDLVLHSVELTLPHPRMLQRAFVLYPLHEIAPERVSAAQLAAVADQAITRL